MTDAAQLKAVVRQFILDNAIPGVGTRIHDGEEWIAFCQFGNFGWMTRSGREEWEFRPVWCVCKSDSEMLEMVWNKITNRNEPR